MTKRKKYGTFMAWAACLSCLFLVGCSPSYPNGRTSRDEPSTREVETGPIPSDTTREMERKTAATTEAVTKTDSADSISPEKLREILLREYGERLCSVSVLGSSAPVVAAELDINSPDSADIAAALKKEYAKQVVVRFVNPEYFSDWNPESVKRVQLGISYDLDLPGICQLTKLGDVEKSKREAAKPKPEEIEALIQAYMANHPPIEKLEKQQTEEGDLVRIKYRIYDFVNPSAEAKEETVKCGTVNFDKRIEESVTGRRIGEAYTIVLSEGRTADERVLCDIEILYCYLVGEAHLSDQYVKDNVGYSSVKAWEDALREELLLRNREQTWLTLMETLMEESEFTLDQDKLVEKAAALSFESLLQARLFGISQEEYLQAKYGADTDLDAFYLKRYRECERVVHEYALIYGIADYAKLSVSQAELQSACEKQNRDIHQLTEKELALLQYSLLREKVIAYMTS